jgi:hypothetical protein
VSIRQLALASCFDDPNMICRCHLFISFSCIQLFKFKQAAEILSKLYKILTDAKNRNKITDERLKVMCIAGIKKLKFHKKYKKLVGNNQIVVEMNDKI